MHTRLSTYVQCTHMSTQRRSLIEYRRIHRMLTHTHACMLARAHTQGERGIENRRQQAILTHRHFLPEVRFQITWKTENVCCHVSHIIPFHSIQYYECVFVHDFFPFFLPLSLSFSRSMSPFNIIFSAFNFYAVAVRVCVLVVVVMRWHNMHTNTFMLEYTLCMCTCIWQLRRVLFGTLADYIDFVCILFGNLCTCDGQTAWLIERGYEEREAIVLRLSLSPVFHSMNCSHTFSVSLSHFVCMHVVVVVTTIGSNQMIT